MAAALGPYNLDIDIGELALAMAAALGIEIGELAVAMATAYVEIVMCEMYAAYF